MISKLFLRLTLVISLLLFTEVLWAQDIRGTAETTVSDARGFGALKIILDSDAVRDELRIDEEQLEKLTDLRRVARELFATLMREHVSANKKLIRAGQPLSRIRAEVVREVDAEVEGRLEEILSTDLFRKFSQGMVAGRLRPLPPLNVLMEAGTIEYLRLDPEVFEELKRKLSIERGTRSRILALKEAFVVAMEPASKEFRSRMVDIVGNQCLEDSGTTKSIPVFDEAFIMDYFGTITQPDVATAIFGKDEELLKELRKTLQKLSTDQAARQSQERLAARAEGRRFDGAKLRLQDDLHVAKALNELLNQEQQQKFSQYAMQLLVLHRPDRFFNAPRVQEYIGLPDEYQMIADRVMNLKNSQEENRIQQVQAAQLERLEEFVVVLPANVQARLENLVELD